MDNQFHTNILHLTSVQNRHSLYAKRWCKCSDEEVKTTLVILHDLGQCHKVFQSFIEWILEHLSGVEIYTLDFVGHGMSSGTRGHFDEFDILVDDALSFINQSIANKKTQVLMLGHGLGGMVILDLYNKYSNKINGTISGMILTSFMLNTEIVGMKYFENNQLLNNLLKHARLYKYFEPNDLSHRPEISLFYAKNPFIVHRPTLNSLFEISQKAKSIYQDSYFLDVPVFVGWSENDKYIYRSGMSYFLKGIKKGLLSEKKYSLMKHDLYNEIDSTIFYEDLLNWINAHV